MVTEAQASPPPPVPDSSAPAQRLVAQAAPVQSLAGRLPVPAASMAPSPALQAEQVVAGPPAGQPGSSAPAPQGPAPAPLSAPVWPTEQSAQPRPLTGVGEAAAQATGRALARPEAREPLPLGAQAVLSRALGADVGHVRLIRDAHAAAATAQAAADALAVGDAVLLSPGQDLASPRGLGLLAHELTHILRDRDPSFVPAVLRAAPSAGPVAPAQPLPTAPGGSPADEETLAEQVEARVGAQSAGQAAGQPGQAAQGVQSPARAPAAPTPWGDLPAPWEPLPFWDDAPATPARSGPPRPAPVARSSVPAGSPAAAPAAGPGSVVRAASTSRSPAAPVAAPAPVGGPDPAPRGPDTGSSRRQTRAPDLDRLAEQVYAVLKRRLATEVRRDR